MIRRSLVAILAATSLLLGMTISPALAARPVFVFSTLLTPEAEVLPPSPDEDAIGHATVLIVPETDLVCWVVNWNRVDGTTVVAAHIHGPATTAQTELPIVTFFQGVPHRPTDIDRGCTISTAWADLIADTPEMFYVNVHSDAIPTGAIRGQLGD